MVGTLMTWTRTRPKQPGWYWYKEKDEPLRIVQVNPLPGQYDTRVLGILRADGWYARLSAYRGRWAGPIPVPK